jgi:hypothetical protein
MLPFAASHTSAVKRAMVSHSDVPHAPSGQVLVHGLRADDNAHLVDADEVARRILALSDHLLDGLHARACTTSTGGSSFCAVVTRRRRSVAQDAHDPPVGQFQLLGLVVGRPRRLRLRRRHSRPG